MPKRRKYITEQKVAILRRHMMEKVPVSDLCEEYRICFILAVAAALLTLLGAAGEKLGRDGSPVPPAQI